MPSRVALPWAVLVGVAWMCGAACGDDDPRERPGRDAGERAKDSGPDARSTTPEDDDAGPSQPATQDAGLWTRFPDENPQCGRAPETHVALFRAAELTFPRGIGKAGEALNVTVTSIDHAARPLSAGLLALPRVSRIMLKAATATYEIETSQVATFGVEVGDVVELSYEYYQQGEISSYTRLSLRDAAGLAFFYTKSRGTELPDGFSVEWGAEQCTGQLVCMKVISKALRLTGSCGDTAELSVNGRASVCDYDALAGSLVERATPLSDKCGGHVYVGMELRLIRTAKPAPEQDAGR